MNFAKRTFRVQKKILVIHKSLARDRSKLSHYVTRYLDGLRAPYVVSEVDDKPFGDLKDDLKRESMVGRYSLLVFVDLKTYLELKPNVQQVAKLYCRKYKTGLLFFSTNHVGFIPEFRLSVNKPQKEQQNLDVELNGNSQLLGITRNGGTVAKPKVPKGLETRWSFLRYDPNDRLYETVEFVRNPRRKRDVENAMTEQATIVLDNGGRDGIKKVFFGGGFPFFLHTMLFMDSLQYLSPVNPIAFSSDRYLQIDVDDIFIAKSGIRIKRTDVKVSIRVSSTIA